MAAATRKVAENRCQDSPRLDDQSGKQEATWIPGHFRARNSCFRGVRLKRVTPGVDLNPVF